MAEVAAGAGAGVVLMHTRGTPVEMRGFAHYDEGVEVEVEQELREAISRALSAGIERNAIVLDPGIGFAKTGEQSVRLLARLDSLAALGFPLLVGPSRKSFLGEILDLPLEDRILGTAVACALAYVRGARIFRVHDVAEAVQALRLAHAIEAKRADTDMRGGH
jgi:dihydropteroate synthase